MILYLDTSALVKRYFLEQQSEELLSSPEEFFFACFDQRLGQAAREEGLATFP